MTTTTRAGNIVVLGAVGVLLLAIIGIAAAVLILATGENDPSSDGPAGPTTAHAADQAGADRPQAQVETLTPPADGPVTIGIAYGTEKKAWLKEAVASFATTPAGAGIAIVLQPMGSLEGAQAFLAGDERLHVWSPASDTYANVFIRAWQARHGSDPFLERAALALTPMVFVSWKERRDAFIDTLAPLDFDTLATALAEPSGWAGIANRPEWGLFKFGHTHPNQSNSGLVTLLLMAYRHHGLERGLELQHILDPAFQAHLKQVETGVSGLIHSTGTMMRDMVLKGPSTYDVVCVYENLAIANVDTAAGRWGALHIDYPAINFWNDHPYYIVDAPWASQAQRDAARTFLAHLLSQPVQQTALVHGFRPADPSIALDGADSPFTRLASQGLRLEVPRVAEAPQAEVVENLLLSWQRAVGR